MNGPIEDLGAVKTGEGWIVTIGTRKNARTIEFIERRDRADLADMGGSWIVRDSAHVNELSLCGNSAFAYLCAVMRTQATMRQDDQEASHV